MLEDELICLEVVYVFVESLVVGKLEFGDCIVVVGGKWFEMLF